MPAGPSLMGWQEYAEEEQILTSASSVPSLIQEWSRINGRNGLNGVQRGS